MNHQKTGWYLAAAFFGGLLCGHTVKFLSTEALDYQPKPDSLAIVLAKRHVAESREVKPNYKVNLIVKNENQRSCILNNQPLGFTKTVSTYIFTAPLAEDLTFANSFNLNGKRNLMIAPVGSDELDRCFQNPKVKYGTSDER
jgi:hypothetical protein